MDGPEPLGPALYPSLWKRPAQDVSPAAGPLQHLPDPQKLEAIIAALNGGATKAAVCRTFGAKRTTLIETLARADWSGPGTTATGKELECPSSS